MSYERELGGVQEKLKKLESEVSEMRDDVREIRDVVVSVKGGWKTIAVIASLSAGIAEFRNGKLGTALVDKNTCVVPGTISAGSSAELKGTYGEIGFSDLFDVVGGDV